MERNTKIWQEKKPKLTELLEDRLSCGILSVFATNPNVFSSDFLN